MVDVWVMKAVCQYYALEEGAVFFLSEGCICLRQPLPVVQQEEEEGHLGSLTPEKVVVRGIDTEPAVLVVV